MLYTSAHLIKAHQLTYLYDYGGLHGSFSQFSVIMFLISWSFTVVSLALASLIYYYVSIKGKAGDWGDGFKSAYFQLALRSLRSLGGMPDFFFAIT